MLYSNSTSSVVAFSIKTFLSVSEIGLKNTNINLLIIYAGKDEPVFTFFLYFNGVSPNFFLKRTIKWEQSENPERIHASVTECPFESKTAALDSLTDSRYSRGDV